MIREFKQKKPIHRLPAGLLPGDLQTEIIANRKTKAVYIVCNGKTEAFNQLSPRLKGQLLERLSNDPIATNDLKDLTLSEALEKYAFCCFGAADSAGDFDANGQLQTSENFVCSNNCKCLNWKSKNITVEGNKLTPRELQILRLLPSDMPDKQIAAKLKITASTLDTHKTNLFSKFKTNSKAGLITKAINLKIIQ